MSAEERLRQEIARVRKGLEGRDIITSRWSFGYLDGLEYALKAMEAERWNGTK